MRKKKNNSELSQYSTLPGAQNTARQLPDLLLIICSVSFNFLHSWGRSGGAMVLSKTSGVGASY